MTPHTGFLLGAVLIFAFNFLSQSPQTFLAFTGGAFTSCIACCGMFIWVSVNGYLSMCNNLVDLINRARDQGVLQPFLRVFITKLLASNVNDMRFDGIINQVDPKGDKQADIKINNFQIPFGVGSTGAQGPQGCQGPKDQ